MRFNFNQEYFSTMYDDFLARILEPDIFLPSQFYGTGGCHVSLTARND
jgi:hypothetical protein